jgi:hypothetical protein
MILVLLRILTTVGLVTIYSIQAILDPMTERGNNAIIEESVMKKVESAKKMLIGPALEVGIDIIEVAVTVRGIVMIGEGDVKNLN